MKRKPFVLLGPALAVLTALITPQVIAAEPPSVTAPAPTSDIEALIEDARERLTEDRLIEPVGSSTMDALRRLRNKAPQRPEVEEISRKLSDKLLEKGRAATRFRAFDRAAQLLQAAREADTGSNSTALMEAEVELAAQRVEYQRMGEQDDITRRRR